MQTFEYMARKKNIRFTFEHEMPQLKVWIDLNNFDKVLMNIFSNAFKYTPDNKSITLIVMESGQFVSIAVKDEVLASLKIKRHPYLNVSLQCPRKMTCSLHRV